MTDRGWLVIACKSGWEEKARRELEEQEYTPDAKYECYLPMAAITRIKRDKPYEAIEPLFHGNIFLFKPAGVRVDDLQVGAIRGTRGVIRLLSIANNGEPSVIPGIVIDHIKARCEQDGGAWRLTPKAPTLQTFMPGDRVELLYGPLAGHLATFKHYDKRGIPNIEVTMFGGVIPTIAANDQLILASQPVEVQRNVIIYSK
jgi:transcription antitermination factor NusG